MDALLKKRLFRPDPSKNETRSGLAAEEATKTKRCLQALRYLWRNAKENSHDPSVQILKDFLCHSPIQTSHRAALPPADSDGSEPEPEEVEMDFQEVGPVAPEPPMSPGDVGFGGDIGGCDDGFSECGESEDLEHDEEVVDPPKSGRVVQTAVRVPYSSDEEDSLTAPTLMLGEEQSLSQESISGEFDSDGNDIRCSQVSSNWLGKFYAKYGKFGKSYDPTAPRSVQQGDKPGMLNDIRAVLIRFEDIGE